MVVLGQSFCKKIAENVKQGSVYGFHLVHRQVKRPCSDQGWGGQIIGEESFCTKLSNSRLSLSDNHSNIEKDRFCLNVRCSV